MPSHGADSDRALSRRAQSDNAQPGDEVRAWKGALEPNGWIAAAGSADGKTVTFRRPPEHKPDGTVVMWERYERRDHEPGQWRSLVAMSEYDCQEGRARTLQETTYTEANLSGRAVTASTPGEWTYPIPGSMMEGSLKIACESSATANRAKAARAAGAEAAAPTATAPAGKKPKKAKAASTTATPAAATTPAKATSAKPTAAKAPAKKKKKPLPPPAEPAAKHIDIPLLPPT
jgi:surface-adhesin protein E